MSTALDGSAIFTAALAMPREKRAELLMELEPDQPKEADYDRRLREELERRWDAYKRGEMKTLDWRAALKQIRNDLDARRSA